MSRKAGRLGIVVAAIAVIGGGLLWNLAPDASASQVCQAWASMGHSVVLGGGPAVQAATTGWISASVVSVTRTPDGRQQTNLQVTGLQSSSTDVPGLGPVDIRVDPTRNAGLSSITANQVSSPFPATHRMTLFLATNINGQQFQSINPATLISTNVTATPPPPGTVFSLAERVDFESADKPGEVAMSMEPGRAAVIQKPPQG